MATPPTGPLRLLTPAERTALERTRQATSERVDRVRRASALLAVTDGVAFAVAAQQAGYRGGSAVTALVRRFNRDGLAVLSIATGRGRRATYDAGARAQVVATAQRAPERTTDGTAPWSLSTLQRTLRRQPGVARLGATTIRRVLHAAGGSYQRSRTWCPTGTAERKRKSGVVTVTDPRTEETRGPSSRRIG